MNLFKIEWIKILKGAGIAGAGCALTYLSEYFTGADFGEMTAVVTAIFATAVNVLRKVGSVK